MRDGWRPAGLPPSFPLAGRLDRRALLRTAAALGVAGPVGIAAGRSGAVAQDAGGAIVRSPSRARVMREVLDRYPSLLQSGAPAGGSVIVANLGDLETVNLLLATSAPTIEILSLVYEGLVGVHPVDGSIVPGLADYERAADGVTYTFRIHPDARFHDGAPVTAADAAFTLETFLDPASLTYSAGAQDILRGYRVVDDRTFELVSKEPVASFLYDVPTVVLPKHVWENVAPDDWPSDPGSTGRDPARVVGSGPFRFVEWVEGDHVTLARNEAYWDRELSRAPYLDELIVQIMPDSAARALSLNAGEIDVARVSPVDVSASDVAVVSYDALAFLYYAYQLDPDRTPLFQEKAVREALFVALDRDAMVETILAGRGEVARGTHPPLSPAYRPEAFAPYAFDPARARDLLAQAGWRDADGDGVVEKDGTRFGFTLLSRGDNSADTSLVAYMLQAWAEIGVAVTSETLPPRTLFEREGTGDFEMVLLRTTLSVDPGQGWMFGTGAATNGYGNAEYDRLEAEQRRTLDPAQRIDLIVEQSRIVWDELPVGVLAFFEQTAGHTERLGNIVPNGFGGLMWSAPYWYLEP